MLNSSSQLPEDASPEGVRRQRVYPSFEVAPLTPHLGAEITDLDLSKPLDDQQLADLRQAFAEWSVLVFRDQTLSREQHKAFGRHWGKLHVHPMNAAGAREVDDPEILIVRTTQKSKYTAGDGWHTDVTCDEIPPLGSMLYVTEVPPDNGGDTMFADMYLAYELLSDAMKAFLADKVAVHDGAIPYVGAYHSTPPEGGYPRNTHPVITHHPETGKPVLYVNSGFTSHIRGLVPGESKAILDYLYGLIATTPKLHCRVRWTPGTLTFWDNRCTQHHAVWDYWPHSRYGERVSILGNERPA